MTGNEGCEANTERWSSGAVVRLGSIHWVDGRWIDDVNESYLFGKI